MLPHFQANGTLAAFSPQDTTVAIIEVKQHLLESIIKINRASEMHIENYKRSLSRQPHAIRIFSCTPFSIRSLSCQRRHADFLASKKNQYIYIYIDHDCLCGAYKRLIISFHFQSLKDTVSRKDNARLCEIGFVRKRHMKPPTVFDSLPADQ